MLTSIIVRATPLSCGRFAYFMYEAVWNDHSPVSRCFCFPEVAKSSNFPQLRICIVNQTQGLCSFLLGDTTLLLHEENWSSSPSSALRVELGETRAQYVWGISMPIIGPCAFIYRKCECNLSVLRCSNDIYYNLMITDILYYECICASSMPNI